MTMHGITNRVSPVGKGQLTISDDVSGDWDAKQDEVEDGKNVRRRRKRSFEPGSDEYASYIEKRVFNKRHAWTPFLWQRKR